MKPKSIKNVWFDKVIQACVVESQKTIKAQAAKQVFEVDGDGVNWAVLDSGIDIGHPWFKKERNCDKNRQFDFTGEGLSYLRTKE